MNMTKAEKVIHYVYNTKAKEVLRLLRISRQTLTKYVKDGIIKAEKKNSKDKRGVIK